MSQQVYNSEEAAGVKPFIDQRVQILEDASSLPTIPNTLAYFTGNMTNTIASTPFFVSGDNIVLQDGSNLAVDTLTAIAPLPGQNYINIAGVNVGTDAPVAGLTIVPPVVASDANVLIFSGPNLGVQFADATFPGVVSVINQTFTGIKSFPTGLNANDIKVATVGAMNIGGSATALNLTPTSGNMTIDQLTLASGSIFIGNTSASSVQVGRVGISTIIPGTADIGTLDHAGAISIGPTNATSIAISKPGIVTTINGIADIVLQDRAGTISIGPSLATAINVGRVGITTTITGTVDATTIDRAGPISIATTNATALNLGRAGAATTINGSTITMNGTVDMITQDRAGLILIGTSLSTGINIGRAGQTTTMNGTVAITTNDRAGSISIGPTLATSLSLGRAGITTTVAGTADIATQDRAGTISIGTTSATGITVGRAAITTTIAGTAGIGGGTITAFSTTSFTSAAGGAIPATPNYMSFNLQLTNNIVFISWRSLAVGVVATSAGAITMTTSLSAPYLPVATLSLTAIVNINGQLYPGYITITTAGAMSFNIQGGINLGVIDFQIGQNVSVRSGSGMFPLT